MEIGAIVDALAERGITQVVEISQGYKLSGAIKTVGGKLADNTFHHAAQPILDGDGRATLRNYLTGFSVINTSAVATEFVVKDGSTVIWRRMLPASMSSTVDMGFPTPLRTALNAALNVACITTGAAVYVNAQGYTAP